MIGLRNLAVDLVSRVPARVRTKLLVAFLVYNDGIQTIIRMATTFGS